VSRKVLGFSGHRHLGKPLDVAAALTGEIKARVDSGTALAAVSSVAAGADMLFAEAILAAGLPWTVLLPMPKTLFREDFQSSEWARAEKLIAQANEIRTLEGTQRPQAYVDVGHVTVDACDILLAVWDGQPAAGPGGTAEIVAYALSLGRPVIVFRETENGVTRIELDATAPSTDARTET